MIFNCVRNIEQTLFKSSQNGFAPKPLEVMREFGKHKTICNYEFKREYIENVQDGSVKKSTDWIITKLLHIKADDFDDYY